MLDAGTEYLGWLSQAVGLARVGRVSADIAWLEGPPSVRQRPRKGQDRRAILDVQEVGS